MVGDLICYSENSRSGSILLGSLLDYQCKEGCFSSELLGFIEGVKEWVLPPQGQMAIGVQTTRLHNASPVPLLSFHNEIQFGAAIH